MNVSTESSDDEDADDNNQENSDENQICSSSNKNLLDFENSKNSFEINSSAINSYQQE